MPSPQTIHAVINCIEHHGLESVTTDHLRAICAQTSEPPLPDATLLAVALDATSDNSMPDVSAILQGPGELDERLEALLTFLAEGAHRYPNLARAHLRTGRYMYRLSRLIRQELADAPLDEGNRQELMEGLALAMSAAIFLGISGSALSPLRIPTVPRHQQAVRDLMRLLPLDALPSVSSI